MSKRKKLNLAQWISIPLAIVGLAVVSSSAGQFTGEYTTIETIMGLLAIACIVVTIVCGVKKKNLCKVCGEEHGVAVSNKCVAVEHYVEDNVELFETGRIYDVVYECPKCKTRWVKREKYRG